MSAILLGVDHDRATTSPLKGTDPPLSQESQTLALQIALATDVALAAIPPDQRATRSAARRALEASIDRYLTDLGLSELARCYRARRQAPAEAR